jgi:DNA-binding MarR family transcriptional regulator
MRDRSSSVNPVDGGPEDSALLFDVWLTSRSVIAYLNRALEGTALDAEDFAVYSVLRKGPISPTDLATWMAAPPTTVSSYVKRLEARGHVRRVPNPADRRSYEIRLTAAGVRAFEAAGRRFLPALAGVQEALDRPAAVVQESMRALRVAIVAASAD